MESLPILKNFDLRLSCDTALITLEAEAAQDAVKVQEH